MSSRRRALVVDPTHNERENLGLVTGGILAATAESAGGCFPEAPTSMHGRFSACAVYDLTSGFMCFRRQVLEAIGLSTVASVGYAFQIELT